VANSERSFPEAWLSKSRTDVTDDFIRYAQPLIGNSWPSIPLINGLQRFTRFEPIYAEHKLANYTPQAY
jgi:6-phosphofructokinase 1